MSETDVSCIESNSTTKTKFDQKRYQREYYSKRKQADPEYLNKKRAQIKQAYRYTRKTIDCAACQFRHRPDSPYCVLVLKADKSRQQDEQKEFTAYLLDAADKKLIEPQERD
jgi:hypothetical protein